MTLDIDGKKIEEPDGPTIAKEFGSIEAGGLSLVILSRDEGNSLTTSGLPTEGWGALLHEVNGVTHGTDISTPLRQEKIIQIFQAYARGDGLWEKEFQWDVVDSGKWPVKRIVFLVATALVILFFARCCTK
jgi:hypothetical protein